MGHRGGHKAINHNITDSKTVDKNTATKIIRHEMLGVRVGKQGEDTQQGLSIVLPTLNGRGRQCSGSECLDQKSTL